MSGRVAGTFAGMVALLFAVPAFAETGGGGGDVPPNRRCPAATGPRSNGGRGRRHAISSAPRTRTRRPVLTLFSATASEVNAGRPVVRFQVRDRSAGCACGSRS